VPVEDPSHRALLGNSARRAGSNSRSVASKRALSGLEEELLGSERAPPFHPGENLPKAHAERPVVRRAAKTRSMRVERLKAIAVLFLGGIAPGLMIGFGLMVYS